MPWRGPEHPGEFPTLGYLVADWMEAHCAIPDGEHAGEPFILTDEQLLYVLWHYRLHPGAKAGAKPSAAFTYRRSQLVRSQKWGKGPLSAGIICAEASGPVLFDGWNADGEPVGKPWATPWIQVVAVSEDQTDNVWTSLVPMIELGALAADIPDTGKTRINVAGAFGSRGLIEPVTSAANSRLGQRLTFAVHDETHSWTAHNGGRKLADTQRRNLAGMGGRSMETTNAWDPSEGSVAQATYEAMLPDVYVDYPEPPKGSIRNKRDRRKVLKAVYAGAPWVDLDRIDAEIQELLPRDPRQAERFYLNRIVAGADRAWDVERLRALVKPDSIAAGRVVTLGFDGARREDSTGLVATDVETGQQQLVGVWERPRDAESDDWEVPEQDVHDAVALAFDEWDLWRLYADPPYWETAVDTWAGTYGEQRVIRWWTNRTKAMAYAIRAFDTSIANGEVLLPDSEPLITHLGNAVRRSTKIRDPDSGAFLWTIGKDGQKSPRKIDLAMAAILSWEARGDALAAGALKKKTYGGARW